MLLGQFVLQEHPGYPGSTRVDLVQRCDCNRSVHQKHVLIGRINGVTTGWYGPVLYLGGYDIPKTIQRHTLHYLRMTSPVQTHPLSQISARSTLPGDLSNRMHQPKIHASMGGVLFRMWNNKAIESNPSI